MGCGHDGKTNCVCEVVNAILDIQDNAEDNCFECPNNCFLQPLGSLVSPVQNQPNTRVFTLTLKNGELFKAFFKDVIDFDGDEIETDDNYNHYKKNFSPFFRVEEIFDNCCATLSVLAKVWDGDEWTFVKTSSCITVDLKCFCAVQCIEDVYVDLICD